MLNRLGTTYPEILNTVDDAIDINSELAEAILEVGLQSFGLSDQPDKNSKLFWHDCARSSDLNKAHSTIRQFWRDWSAEGFAKEVKPMLDLYIADIKKFHSASETGTRILLPGAGLGRLFFELCLAGYHVEGNEISYHQLIASNFILNHTEKAEQFKLHPFVTCFNNNQTRHGQMHSVSIPDIHPGTAMEERQKAEKPPGSMSMSAGDFITSYNGSDSAGSFDVVVTHYFIDTGPNVIRYLETIRNCLTEHGIWINIGPLLWHVDEHIDDKQKDPESPSPNPEGDLGIAEPGSFQLSNDEMLDLAKMVGFELLSHGLLPASMGGYIQDEHSMLQSRYVSSHYVMRKIAYE